MAERTRIDDIADLIAPDFADALQKWDSYLRYEKNVSAHTLRAYQTDLKHFTTFLTVHLGGAPSINDLSEIKLQDFRGWLARKAGEGVSARSRARSLSGVKNFLKYLDKHGIMHNAAIGLITSPKIPRTLPKPISEDQAKRLINFDNFEQISGDETEIRDRALFLILYGLGLRISEALALNIGDIPHSDGFWRIMGKGRKERIVPTLPIITRMLERHLENRPDDPEAPIFLGTQGKRLNAGVAQKALRNIRREQGLPETLTPHALRHSYATHLLSNGANLREIQELLGHASLSTTQMYTDVDNAKILEIFKKAHPRA